MLTMTQAAGEYLTAVLEAANASQDSAIRIRLLDDALEPVVDRPRADDQKFDHNGRIILVLDARACDYLDESMLDIEETPDGPMLLILQ